MRLQDGMTLYHGSYTVVEKINPDMCSEGKDFGKGFYMTSNLRQARNFIPTSLLKAKSAKKIPQDQNFGFVSVFRLHLKEDIHIYEFPESSGEWLWFISQNRRKALAEALIPLIEPQLLFTAIFCACDTGFIGFIWFQIYGAQRAPLQQTAICSGVANG